MLTNYPRGSEWRKWDLHVHTPGTKCNDTYKLDSGKDVWEEFCEMIEKSDVDVIGITDYYSFDNYFIFIEKFKQKYPQSTKVFFPNIEVRLNESVNSVQEEINLHLLFRTDIKQEDAKKFISLLKTVKTDKNGKEVTCDELKTEKDYEGTTVTRKNITSAIKDVFGEKIARQDCLLILTAVNNDGVRPSRGKKRKEVITDEIDKFSDGFFGGSQNTEHFLKNDRLEDKEQKIKYKPVFSGSDSHSFDDLKNWLGKTVKSEEMAKEVTWIKSDKTYEGLLQTLIETQERVKIGATKPDEKDAYKIIDRIEFSGTADFPAEISVNTNLTSIIGSRSSGKSALINYVAHAVDRITVEKRIRGPAAKILWQDVALTCTVQWADGSKDDSGKIVFLPQGYLSRISEKPEEITEKIKPVLFRKFPIIEAKYNATLNTIESSNKAIESAVNRWFLAINGIATIRNEIKTIGEKSAITIAKDDYQTKIDEIKKSLSLTDQEVEDYQRISSEILSHQEIVRNLTSVKENLTEEYFDDSKDIVIDLTFEQTFNPSIDNLPQELKTNIEDYMTTTSKAMVVEVRGKILTFRNDVENKIKQTSEALVKINTDNKLLIEKNKKNEQLAKLIDEFNKQNCKLTSIKDKEIKAKTLNDKANVELVAIDTNLKVRQNAIADLVQSFSSLDQSQQNIEFGAECSFSNNSIEHLSELYNRKETKVNEFITDGCIDIIKARLEYRKLLSDINAGKISLKSHENPQAVAINTLTFSEEIRFIAIMEGDTIGGFSESSMTPGKQALFALTLILDESDDAWPLLIDQPEDDLDSRSIYDHIACYFKSKKKERQIIMVSHNANLVVGADSEQIIVANKHGVDRRNKNAQLFNYLTGSIENTHPRGTTQIVLESCGIREHACDILDGGEEAFEKRKNKYKL